MFIGLDFIKTNPKDKLLYFGFLVLLMVVFAGLRVNCDADYSSYVEIYQNMPTAEQWYNNLNNAVKKQTYGEPLFVTLCIALKTIDANPQFVFIIISALTFILLGIFLWRVSPYPFTSLFLYNTLFFLAGGFTQIRFGLANVIVLHAFFYLFNGQFKAYFLLILIGAGFHVSALIGTLLLPLYILKVNKRLCLALVIIGLGLSFLDLNTLIISYFFDLETDSSYTSYLGEMDYLTKAPNTVLIIYSGLILIFVVLAKSGLVINDDRFNLLFGIAVMSILVGGIAIQVNILARFTVILQIVFIIIIPYLMYYHKFKGIAILVLLAYSLFKYHQFLAPGGFIKPYQNILFL